MDNNNQLLNSNEVNKTEQPTAPELTEQMVAEKLQYEYLKELNKKLTLFKKQTKLTEKNEEQTEQTIRR